jgi:hypothetical protein
MSLGLLSINDEPTSSIVAESIETGRRAAAAMALGAMRGVRHRRPPC